MMQPAAAGPDPGPLGGPSINNLRLDIASLPQTPQRKFVEFDTRSQFSQ
jgi:hypothetical protein